MLVKLWLLQDRNFNPMIYIVKTPGVTGSFFIGGHEKNRAYIKKDPFQGSFYFILDNLSLCLAYYCGQT